jgi:bifunctional non-homologous end joining protein LigD
MGVRDEKGALRYAGRVGSGFDERSLASLGKRLKRLAQKTSPFENAPRAKGVHWVRPELVAEVKFAGWTDDGLVRQGSFVGLREDKPARQVKKEKPAEPDAAAGVHITHPDRVLFKKPRTTKLDLARYYESVADWILPHLEDRPLSLVRCPQGPAGKCFFQRNAHGILAHRGEFIVADSIEAVIGLVQNGVIELHTWGSRARAPLRPDRMILDLDPDPALPWAKVVEGARLARTLLDELSLESYVKTTGGKGLHLVVPLITGPSWADVKLFSQRIAQHLENVIPQMFTSTVSKAARVKRIFVDYLRNQEGATAVCAYSVRAREGAAVSVPLAWDELSADLKPSAFNVRTLQGRLQRLRKDPWAGYAKQRQRLTKRMLARL